MTRVLLAVALLGLAATPARSLHQSAAHALSTGDQLHRLRCTTQPLRCQAALNWQRAERRRLAREVHRLRRHLRRVHTPTVREAALLAGQAFGVDPWAMLRVAGCETGGTMDPYAVNPSSGATGAWQFLSSTWSHTPFAAWPRTNPYAQALAAAQIVRADGSWAQWSCAGAAR